MGYEELKRKIEIFSIEELIEVIKSQPIIEGKNDYKHYNKIEQEELRQILIKITKLCLDLAEKEEKFLLEKINKTLGSKSKIIIDILKSL